MNGESGGGGSTTSSLGAGVWELCERLRAEKLMVTSELHAVKQLHESIEERLHALGLLSWNMKLHQWTLSGLLASHPSIQPECTFAVLATIDAAQLEPAYRRLGHHHSTVASILNTLLGSPRAVAELLHGIDSTPNTDASSTTNEELCRSLYSLLYGHCVFPGDEAIFVEVLCALVHLQVVPHANPRLVLRRGTAAFPRLLRLFTDGLYAVKVFLTEALHDSVMLVLCQDDAFLDIDSNKMLLRFPPQERARRFGKDATTAEYERRVSAHRRNVVEKLVLLTHSFIKGIVDALHSLPPSLVWLIQQLHSAIADANAASLICTDLLVTNLLCAAITNPETFGVISDTPVSSVARTNLIQVAQLVQVLALSRHEPPPSMFQVFTRQFEESPIIGVVDRVLSLRLPPMEGAMGGASVSESGAPLAASFSPLNRSEDPIRRAHFIGSLADVNTIVSAVQGAATGELSDGGIGKDLRTLAARLPSTPFTSSSASSSTTTTTTTTTSSGTTPTLTPSRSGTLRNLVNSATMSVRTRPSSAGGGGPGGRTKDDQLLNGVVGGEGGAAPSLPPEMFDVVVFTLGDEDDDKIGLRSEEGFMEISRLRRRTKRNSEGGNEKRTRFLEEAHSSVGSAPSECTTEGGSDTGEEEEEEEEDGDGQDVASLASSGEKDDDDDDGHEDRLLLDEDGASTLPDNVSELGAMSGRASPSLSGRETPDGAESTIAAAGGASTVQGGAAEVAAREALMPRLPVTVRKQNAEGLEEKFGKFSLPASSQPHRYRDDQRSLLSDSWSTDVVPSDNEGPTLQLPQAPPLALILGGGGGLQAGNAAGGLGGGLGQAGASGAPVPPGGVQSRSGRSGSLRNGSTAGGEDKSDTWSLDAVASDSEADRIDRSDNHPLPVAGHGSGVNIGGVGGGHHPASSMASADSGGGQGPSSSSIGNGADSGRMRRRQSSGSSFYSEEGRRASGGGGGSGGTGNPLMPVSKPTSEAGEDAPGSSSQAYASSISPPPSSHLLLDGHGTSNREHHHHHHHHHRSTLQQSSSVDGGGAESAGGGGTLKGKFSIDMRSKKAAILQGLHRIGDKMKRGNVATMRASATMDDLPSVESSRRDGAPGGSNLNESRSNADLLQLDESSPDDILAKYSRQHQQQQPVVLVDLLSDSDLSNPPIEMAPPLPVQTLPSRPYYSSENVSQCAAFLDAKRKLRFVLSGVGFLPTWYASASSRGQPLQVAEAKDELIELLQVLLAEAVNGRERALCAQIRETIRCLGVFTTREVRKLLRSLREDHRRRASYTLYLQQSRLSLLRLQAALERLSARVQREKSLAEECLVEMWINRFYIPSRHPTLLQQLDSQFVALYAQDEKTEWVEEHIGNLWRQLEASGVFRAANINHREYARKCVERLLMGRIYHMAFYPNNDADIYRDEVLYKALQRLAASVSPAHGVLAIPEALRGECPWPSAQHEIAVINAYKSPRDKLACVSRACETISNLLALTSSSPAAADDVTPILVYVLVMANPPALLSNVQYVDGFFTNQMDGSDAYWWTQFTAAIEYIKTLL